MRPKSSRYYEYINQNYEIAKMILKRQKGFITKQESQFNLNTSIQKVELAFDKFFDSLEKISDHGLERIIKLVFELSYSYINEYIKSSNKADEITLKYQKEIDAYEVFNEQKHVYKALGADIESNTFKVIYNFLKHQAETGLHEIDDIKSEFVGKKKTPTSKYNKTIYHLVDLTLSEYTKAPQKKEVFILLDELVSTIYCKPICSEGSKIKTAYGKYRKSLLEKDQVA